MTAPSPRVTIGLPVYNGARYLAGALDGLLKQTLTDFELILADNASTDETPAIGQAYAAMDSRIRYVRNERNLGAAPNFNLVLGLARAQLFKWAAYDDRCAPEFLERCVELLDRSPEVVLAYPQTMIIDEAEQVIGPYPDAMDLRIADPVQRYDRYHARFRSMALVNVLYGVIRTEVLRQTPGIAAYANSDVVLIGELALRGQFAEVPSPLFHRRDHPLMTVRAFPSVRERAVYLDPGRQGKSSHPYLRMALEHVASLRRVPMRSLQRLRCYAIVARFVGWHALEYIQDRMPGRSAPYPQGPAVPG